MRRDEAIDMTIGILLMLIGVCMGFEEEEVLMWFGIAIAGIGSWLTYLALRRYDNRKK